MWILAVFLAQTLAELVAVPKAKGVIVSQLMIHPIKSCKGISVSQAAIGKFGFEFDRLWMLVDALNHSKFITQRENPTLALVSCVLKAKGVKYTDGGELVVSVPGKKDLIIKFKGDLSKLKRIETNVWEKPVIGLDEGDEAAKWFSEYLRFPVRFVIKCRETVRPLAERNTPPLVEYPAQTAFADGYPYLIATTTSLSAVNARLPPTTTPRIMEHFRPNIILSPNQSDPSSTLPAFVEDYWKTLRIGTETIYIVSHCTRCQMPGNDIETGGGSDPQITKTLMKFRRVDKGKKYEPCFGMNAVSRKESGVIRVGDFVEVVEDGVVHDGKVGIWRV
ncbi:UNVERIFIED_CONTAM: hypothetical protein HDU68_009345 [Siphonaria sp. JEL0065]|nr:hypothetical protein HDU68_009345 [Siphonaria sp. JEL0065]